MIGSPRIRRAAHRVQDASTVRDSITNAEKHDSARREKFTEKLTVKEEEENRGGLEYSFQHPERGESLNAKSALAHFRPTGRSPLSKWQKHLFRYQTQN